MDFARKQGLIEPLSPGRKAQAETRQRYHLSVFVASHAALARQGQEATPTTAVQWRVRSREASKVRGRAFSRFDSG